MKIINFDTQKTAQKPEHFSPFRERLHQIVFEAETPEGRWFDVALLFMILLSIVLLMLETVPSLSAKWGHLFYVLEWVITVFFTVEYIVRLYCVYRPWRYITSFYGIVDITSILPVYLDILFPGAHSLLIVRSLRLMRLFRIFKLDILSIRGIYWCRPLKLAGRKSWFLCFSSC